MRSEYPETVDAYRRMQSRWLRNLLLYGPQYGARADVRVTLKTVILGASMLVAPLTAIILGPIVTCAWAVLVVQAFCAKVRYIFFTARLYSQRVSLLSLLTLLPLTFLDFAIWALPLFDLLSLRRRQRW